MRYWHTSNELPLTTEFFSIYRSCSEAHDKVMHNETYLEDEAIHCHQPSVTAKINTESRIFSLKVSVVVTNQIVAIVNT